MRIGLHRPIIDTIEGRGVREKDVESLCFIFNNEDLVSEIDQLTFDHGKTEICFNT
jgi:hypothetical protein